MILALNGLVVVFVVATDRIKRRLQEEPVDLEALEASMKLKKPKGADPPEGDP